MRLLQRQHTSLVPFHRLDALERPMVRLFADTLDRPWRRSAACLVNRAGDGWLYAVLALAVLVAGDGTAWITLGRCGTALVLAFAVYLAVKPALARSRPLHAPGWATVHKPPLDLHSCPSGHFMTAVIVSVQAVQFMPGLPTVLAAALFCAAIGTASLALGHHYPSDLAAGTAIAALASTLSNIMVAG